MWYFCWVLGVGFACACGIINVMWLESEHMFDNAQNEAQLDNNSNLLDDQSKNY